ncbi:hypothetical protein IKG68_02375 [Candidatus Saccharibacteria bacterium]|nr:hypothetical protein [Candidatus Saccharibacteria bacterium]
MTTEELAIRLQDLTDTERDDIEKYINIILSRRHSLAPYSKEDIKSMLAKSRRQAAKGQTHTWSDILAMTQREYGISI